MTHERICSDSLGFHIRSCNKHGNKCKWILTVKKWNGLEMIFLYCCWYFFLVVHFAACVNITLWTRQNRGKSWKLDATLSYGVIMQNPALGCSGARRELHPWCAWASHVITCLVVFENRAMSVRQQLSGICQEDDSNYRRSEGWLGSVVWRIYSSWSPLARCLSKRSFGGAHFVLLSQFFVVVLTLSWAGLVASHPVAVISIPLPPPPSFCFSVLAAAALGSHEECHLGMWQCFTRC